MLGGLFGGLGGTSNIQYLSGTYNISIASNIGGLIISQSQVSSL